MPKTFFFVILTKIPFFMKVPLNNKENQGEEKHGLRLFSSGVLLSGLRCFYAVAVLTGIGVGFAFSQDSTFVPTSNAVDSAFVPESGAVITEHAGLLPVDSAELPEKPRGKPDGQVELGVYGTLASAMPDLDANADASANLGIGASIGLSLPIWGTSRSWLSIWSALDWLSYSFGYTISLSELEYNSGVYDFNFQEVRGLFGLEWVRVFGENSLILDAGGGYGYLNYADYEFLPADTELLESTSQELTWEANNHKVLYYLRAGISQKVAIGELLGFMAFSGSPEYLYDVGKDRLWLVQLGFSLRVGLY